MMIGMVIMWYSCCQKTAATVGIGFPNKNVNNVTSLSCFQTCVAVISSIAVQKGSKIKQKRF